MSGLLLTALALYLIALLLITVLSNRTKESSKSKSSYYLGNRKLQSVPLAVSVMMTAFSAFNFVVFPAHIAKFGLYITAAIPAFIIVLFPIRNLLIPKLYAQKSISAYAFLEERSHRLHLLTSLLFIFWRFIWLGFSLYATSLVLAAITDYPQWVLITTTGIIATLYTSFGGLRTVVWTDLLQFILLSSAILLIIILSYNGIKELLISGSIHLKPLHPIDPQFFSFDISVPITLPSALIGASIAFFARYGADQMIIQRYKAAPSLKAAQKVLTINMVIVVGVLLLLIPFAFAIQQFAIEKSLHPSTKPPLVYIIAFMKAQPLPSLTLLILALFSATLSSIDSGINTIAVTVSEDIVKRSIARKKSLSFCIGTVSIALGLLFIPLMASQDSLFSLINKSINAFGSPLLVLVLLGLFNRKLAEPALFWGGLLGGLLSTMTVFYIQNISLHYYAVINALVTVMAIFGVSLFIKAKKSI